jgi:hypothetical protein
MNQYILVTKRWQALFGIPFGGLFACLMLDALVWHPARYSGSWVAVVVPVLLGLFGLLVMIPQSISMMITPRIFMVADSNGITLRHYRGSTTIDRDHRGKIYVEKKKGGTITIPWDQVLSFSRDRSSLGDTGMPGKPPAKSKCLRITIDPSVDLSEFTTKGLIHALSAFDANTLSRSARASHSAEELENYKYAQCCILARFLPGGIEHAIQVLEEMKKKYTEEWGTTNC